MRIPVLSKENKPLMPSKPSRVRRWLKQGKAEVVVNDLGLFCVRLLVNPSGYSTQKVTIGVDPGSCFTGIAILSKNTTYVGFNLDLPRKQVSHRLEERRMLRRIRRGRRIDRSKPFKLRNHRQARFDNRKGNQIPPSIKANKDLEIRVISELSKLFPVTTIVVEKLNTSKSAGFSRAVQGQNWFLKMLKERFPFVNILVVKGYNTSNRREYLRLRKCEDKSKRSIEAHINDAIAIASFGYLSYISIKGKESFYRGEIRLTRPEIFSVSRLKSRPRKLHDIQFKKGGKRRQYGGYGSAHRFKNGDVVRYSGRKGSITGYVSANDIYSLESNKRLKQGIVDKKTVKLRSATGLRVCKIPHSA